MRAITIRIALAAVVLAACPAAAQVAEARPWSASLTGTADRFEDATPRWESWSAVEFRLARRFARGSASVEGGRFRRFGGDDRVGGVDLYLDLWPAAYGNARVLIAPDAVAIPRSDVAFELFQGLSGGWEPSAGYRQSRYADGTVRVVSVAAARYFGRWYGRARVAHARRSGSGGTSSGVLLRRTLGSESELVELSVSGGSEVVTLAEAGSVEVALRRTSTVSAGGRLDLAGPVGLALTVAYTDFEGAPARGTAGIGLVVRW